eukprot:c10335_g1_i1 orf=217-3657(+)
MQEGGAPPQSLAEPSSPHALPDSLHSPDCPGPSSVKSKKRERPDQSVSASEKDQLNEDYASPLKRECVGKFTDEDGGLANTDAVDQLIIRMKQEQVSSQRSIHASVVVATSKEDCLRKFVQLGGVAILEEWIQDGSKIRSSDAGLKVGDKGLDEEMLAILQALEKLPINLEVLKGCSIGKSVKHLRSVRNVEIQKKAKKLVDTWRKRVDFEMKQSSPALALAPEHIHHVDSMSRASDLFTAKAVEVTEQMLVPSDTTPSQEVNVILGAETFVSTPSNASTSDASPKVHEKSTISSEKDTNKKATRLCSSSVTSALSPVKKQKHSTVLATGKECKEEKSNALDFQKLKEKDSKCENSATKNEPACDTVIRKTNEYRKKLRSGGSSAAPCSTDLQANAPSSHAVPTRENADDKNACMDSNTGDSEQLHVEIKCINSAVEMDAPIPKSNKAGSREKIPTKMEPRDGKTDHVNESCLSSQSSCNDKKVDACPTVTFQTTTLSVHTSQLHGDTELQPSSKLLLHQVDGLRDGNDGSLRLSEKSTSSINDCPGERARKSSPEAEPNALNASTAVVMSEKNELADRQQGGGAGAVDHEESCCSFASGAENALQVSAEYPSSHATVHRDACLRDGVAFSENSKAIADGCQESGKEKDVVFSTHSNSNTVAEFSTSLLAANCNNANSTSQITCELAKADDVKTSEIPATTHSPHDFDLNEGFAMDEFLHDRQPSCVPPATSTSSALIGSGKATGTLSDQGTGKATGTLSDQGTGKATGTLSAPVAVSATTKGAFIPPLNSLNKCDIGWKGSAATSAFRPAEPRHVPAKSQSTLASSMNEVRIVKGFDLNVADQGTFEDCPNRLSSSGQLRQEAHLDLNCDGNDVETEISTSLPVQLPSESPRKVLDKRTVLDFDLNEQLDEVMQEQEVLSASAARSYNSPFGGLSGPATRGDVTTWHSAGGASFPVASTNMARTEQLWSGSMNQPVVNIRQTTPTTILPSPLSSVVYSQTASFSGGPPVPFPASFTYNPVSAGPDSSFAVSKTIPGTIVSSVGVRSRPEASLVRPSYMTNIDDGRGGNGFYTWGRTHQNIYGGSGPTIISYNDAAVGGREHVVNFDGSASLEEQMRLFQQTAVPVAPLKRKDSDYFSGLKQSTWH